MHPAADLPATLGHGRAGGTAGQFDDLFVPGILGIGGDSKLEHAGARHHPLDEIDLRLIDLGHDHLELIDAIAADGHFLLAARIHAAAHGRHQLVHVHGGRSSRHVVLQVDRLGTRSLPRQSNPSIAEVDLLHTLQKGLSGGCISGLEPHRNAIVGHPRHGPLPTILAGEQLLDPAHAVVNLPGRLPGGIDLVDENHAALEVDTQSRWPAEPCHHGACRERDEHRRQAAPHVGSPQLF